MDPVAMIVTALATGAAATAKDVAGQAVKDGYAGFKALLIRKFGRQGDVEDALDSVEQFQDAKRFGDKFHCAHVISKMAGAGQLVTRR